MTENPNEIFLHFLKKIFSLIKMLYFLFFFFFFSLIFSPKFNQIIISCL